MLRVRCSGGVGFWRLLLLLLLLLAWLLLGGGLLGGLLLHLRPGHAVGG